MTIIFRKIFIGIMSATAFISLLKVVDMETLSFIAAFSLGLIILAIPLLTLKFLLHAPDRSMGDHEKESIKNSLQHDDTI